MSRIVAITNVTLDGVMQAPARPDEDRRDGFVYGGWAAPYAAMQHIGESMAAAGALLFGRRTYEDFYSVWPARKDNPYTEVLNRMTKYVASTTLSEPLPWMNSILLPGDASTSAAAVKANPGKDIVIFGSGALIRSLLPHGVIDEYLVLIHPLVLGAGRTLFGGSGAHMPMQLASSSTTPNGVVIAKYHPAADQPSRPPW
jgi:dihydrofolate reductase